MMKTNWMMTTMLICASAIWLATATESAASGGHEHGGELNAIHEANEDRASDEEQQTAAELWRAIDADIERLSHIIDSGKLADVHKIAFGIRDLAKELSEKSTDLSEAKQKMLAGYVDRVAEHAKNLDMYGDTGDAERTAMEFAELEKRLSYMRKLYPESPSGDAHEEHNH